MCHKANDMKRQTYVAIGDFKRDMKSKRWLFDPIFWLIYLIVYYSNKIESLPML